MNITFADIYRIVRPTDPAAAWSAADKRFVVAAAKRGGACVDAVLAAMGEPLESRSPSQKRRIRRKLWPQPKP